MDDKTVIEANSNTEFHEVDPQPTIQEDPNAIWSYFLAAVKVYYLRDKALKERTVNVLMTMARPAVNQQGIRLVQQSAIGRIHQENGVPVDAIKDSVIQNISFLGQMTEAEFKATENMVGVGGEAQPQGEGDRDART